LRFFWGDSCACLSASGGKRFERCNSDLRNLGLHLFFGDGREGSLLASRGSDPLPLWDQSGNHYVNEGMSCSGQGLVHFNATNLSIVQCHRTTYLQFTPLYFITNEENTRIVDFRTNNVGSFISWRFHKVENTPICATCPYEVVCKKGCPGAQFEESGELYMPITSLCNFFKEKYEHLYQLYKSWGLLKMADEEGWLNEPGFSWLRNKYRQEVAGNE
jgi:radical SAM protein with 4Fe4S-binding SPASM domain